MPSPTSSTRPTSRASMAARVPSISFTMTEMISSARNAMTAPLDQLIADHVELGADAGVIDPVADAHDQSAQQFRIHVFFEQRLDVRPRPHVVAQSPTLIARQRHRRAGHDHPPPLLAVVMPPVGVADRPD